MGPDHGLDETRSSPDRTRAGDPQATAASRRALPLLRPNDPVVVPTAQPHSAILHLTVLLLDALTALPARDATLVPSGSSDATFTSSFTVESPGYRCALAR